MRNGYISSRLEIMLANFNVKINARMSEKVAVAVELSTVMSRT